MTSKFDPGDTIHMTRDRADSVVVSSSLLVPVLGPFLFGGCLTMIILMMPLSTFDKADRQTNFWTYALLQQGLWAFTVTLGFEIFFNASFCSLIPDGRVPRVMVWVSSYLASPVLWLFFCANRLESSTYAGILPPITPVLLVVLQYGVLTRAIVRGSQPSVKPVGQTDLDAATFGLEESSLAKSADLSDSSPSCLDQHPVQKQFMLAGTFLVGTAVIFVILEIFTVQFSSAKVELVKAFWFVGFVAMNIAVKELMCRLGIFLDLGKRGSASAYYTAEVNSNHTFCFPIGTFYFDPLFCFVLHLKIICSLYYFTFYRFLFENVRSVTSFVVLQFVHVVAEWFTYAFRASSHWFRLTRKTPIAWLFKTSRIPGGGALRDRDWACYRTNAFGCRLAVSIFSGFAYLAFLTFLNYGWNKPYFGTASHKTDEDMRMLSVYIGLAMLIEVVNGTAMNVLFFQPNNLNVLVFMSSLFRHGRPYEFASMVMLLSCNLFVDIFVPFVDKDFGDLGGDSRTYAFVGAVACLLSLCGLSLMTARHMSAVAAEKEPGRISSNLSTSLHLRTDTNVLQDPGTGTAV